MTGPQVSVTLKQHVQWFPVVLVAGPRRAGKAALVETVCALIWCSLVACLSAVAGEIPPPLLTPVLDTPIDADRSVVYCATSPLAWSALTAAVGQPITMENESPLVAKLNAFQIPEGVVPDGACFAMAGRVKDGIVAAIEAGLREKYGDKAPRLPFTPDPNQTLIVSYAYMQRHVPFHRAFQRSRTAPLKFCDAQGGKLPVAFFGCTGGTAEAYSGQVRIIHWSSPSEFTLRLVSRLPGEAVVLARIRPGSTLEATVAAVAAQRANAPASTAPIKISVNEKQQWFMQEISRGDRLVVPLLRVNHQTNHDELCNRKLKSAGYEDTWIDHAWQAIEFELDETGARVKSEDYLSMSFGGSSSPRDFVFNQPFLACLWRDAAPLPYFAVWVSGPDVLVPFEPPRKKPRK